MEAHALNAIKLRINAGDRQGARQELAAHLEADPNDVDAWALLAILVKEPAEQAECYRQILRVDPENRLAAAWLGKLTLPGQPVLSEGDELQGFLQKLNRPTVDEEAIGQPEERAPAPPGEQAAGPAATRTARRGLLDRILRPRGREAWAAPVPGDLEEEAGASPQPGQLGPDEIIRLAGGPLSPEERRTCRHCGAVVSRSASRCPWCSSLLPDAGTE